jgi:hypothetical protein
MAEFNYFWTKQEMLAFLNAAFEAGFTIHNYKDVATPTLVICNSGSEIAAALAHHEFNFVLTRADITRHPFKLSPFMRDGAELWYFRTRVGGPCIEVYFNDLYERDGRQVVPCTLLAYHAKILHPETDQFEPAGDAIKKEFNAMIAPLRKKAKKVKSIKRTAYVSPGVVSLLASGYVLAKPFDAAS